MAITIRDVAAYAGVSISTVSRVLNDTCAVRPDKRKRVEEAVATLGYTPNPAARSLLKRETGGLGILLPFIGGEFFSEFLESIDLVARKHGFFLMISTSHRNEEEFKAVLRSMYRRVDGLLVMAPEMVTRDLFNLAWKAGPTVFVNTNVDMPNAQVFNFDNFGGIYTMTRHLLELGHRRLAFIKGPEAAYDAHERLEGFRAAVAEYPDVTAYELLARPEKDHDSYSQEAGYLAGCQALGLAERPTAIVGANDQTAIGAIRALSKAGVRVPEECSVTGFDDVPSARYTTPPLTTVHVPLREVGRRAIEALIGQIRGLPSTGTPGLITVEPVLRQSTAPPPAA